MRGAVLAAAVVLLGVAAARTWADAHDAAAQAKIEASPCGDSTVGQRLTDETRIHSRRDMGWRFFPGDGFIDAERAMRVSKSMEVRFRWRVTAAGAVTATSEAAQGLCQ